MVTTTTQQSAAGALEGVRLPGGWTVGACIPRGPLDTGGNFSVSYHLTGPDGQPAFLKALDLQRALRHMDPARQIEVMTKAFNFERDLLATCGNHRMSKVVRALDDGTVQVGGTNINYLIFEKAEGGDIRRFLEQSDRFDLAFSFRTLHHVAVGLQQLHLAGIAHQDIKPSNVLVFEQADTRKIADLGRASSQAAEGPVDGLRIPGDWQYAPPELLYGELSQTWGRRRQASDLYQLGNLLYFLFTDVSATLALINELPPGQEPANWTATFREVLPYLDMAFDDVAGLLAEALPPLPQAAQTTGRSVEDLTVAAFRQLCAPDPDVRGHPSALRGRGSQYSTERYVALFNLLARRAEIALVNRAV